MKHNPSSCMLAVCMAIVLVLTGCSNFLSPVKAFLDEYTNTAAVADVTFSRTVPQDGSGVICIPATDSCKISFLLRNPQGYDLQPSAVLVSGTPLNLTDYSLALAADKQSVQLEFSQAFLAAHDMGGDISVTLALFEPATGRNFPPYTLQLKANTPPPVPQGGCIMANATNHYVVCFNLDLGTIHGDLKSIEVNGYSTTVTSSVGPASLTFVNPSFTATNPGSLVPLGARPSFTAGSGTTVSVYLVTNELVDANNNEYRITITDAAGFSTTYSLWTLSDFLGPVKVTNLAGTELDDGVAISQDAGLTTGTVLIKAPTTTDQGAPVSDVTVYYQLYRDASYTILHSSGTFTGTQASVAVPPVLVYIKAWAQKNGYSDSLAKQLSVRATAVRLCVNEDSMSGIELGTEAYPYKTIAAAIGSLDTKGDTDNTIFLLNDVTTSVSIDDSSLFLTIDGKNYAIDGQTLHRCFNLDAGTVTVKNTNFMRGSVSSQNGGGILVTGADTTLTLIDCNIDNNAINPNPSGGSKGAGMAIESGAKVTMQNCNVTNNRFNQVMGTAFGGGIALDGSSSTTRLTMRACKISGNTASAYSASYGTGGGIYATGTQAELSLTNCQVQNNRAATSYSGLGGGLAVVAGVKAIMDDVTVSGNHASESTNQAHEALGGGMYIVNSSLTINNNLTVSGNTAAYRALIASTPSGKGGGLYLQTAILINNGTFIIDSNLAAKGYDGYGGGLYLVSNTGLNLTGVTVTNNTAAESYTGKGGGIYIENGTHLILNSVINGNFAARGPAASSGGHGGGIYIYATTDTKIWNCTLSANQASVNGVGWGGAIFNLGGQGVVILSGTNIGGNIATTSTLNPGYGGGVASGGGQLSVYDSSISNNTANMNFNGSGGGLFLGEGNYTISGTTTVHNNKATQGAGAGKGGGIYIDTGGAVVVFFSGGLVTGNTAGGTSPQGNGIWAGNTFSMQGNASAAASASDNDVFLKYLSAGNSYVTISISSMLSSTIAAILTPEDWHLGMLLFSGSTYIPNLGKFNVSNTGYKIDSTGFLQSK